jgi:hypothetical protein
LKKQLGRIAVCWSVMPLDDFHRFASAGWWLSKFKQNDK